MDGKIITPFNFILMLSFDVLFPQEAHAMVREAKVKQAAAEKRFKEANNKVDKQMLSRSTGLSIEAGSQHKSAGCQITLCWLVLPGYQLKRNTLCLKSLKTLPRLQEIASNQLFFSKNFQGRMAPDTPSLGVQSAPKHTLCMLPGPGCSKAD